MVEQLLNHIARHQLCKTSDKILLAVSGGIDSMVMAHLFREAGFHTGVVHCNFQLRGEASLADEALVNTYCVDHRIPFHTKRFNTEAAAQAMDASIQVAARNLRYEYFYEIKNKFGYDLIATAHHLNDNLETILLNFVRGTGINGLTGIPLKNGDVIRPMLFATRDEIYEHATFQRIVWRDDASNETDDYSRNLIRHHVIPKLKEINPSLERSFKNNLERLAFAKTSTSKNVAQIAEEYSSIRNGQLYIHKNILTEVPDVAVVLWELLKEKGFNYDQCRLVPSIVTTGKQIRSKHYVLTVDREHLIVDRIALQYDAVEIDRETSSITAYDNTLALEVQEMKKFTLDGSPSKAQLDLAKIRFPLLWRTWQPGDVFKPLGMPYRKKVSDFLIDQRVPLNDKQRVTVLVCGDEIVWIVGYRVNDDFKVTSKTAEVLVIERL